MMVTLMQDARPYLHTWSAHSTHAESEYLDTAAEPERVTDRPKGHATGDDPKPSAVRRTALSGSRASASLLRLLRPLLDACVVGGVTLTPVMSLLGWVGLTQPPYSILHQAATVLLYAAMVWLGFALALAHLLRGERRG